MPNPEKAQDILFNDMLNRINRIEEKQDKTLQELIQLKEQQKQDTKMWATLTAFFTFIIFKAIEKAVSYFPHGF